MHKAQQCQGEGLKTSFSKTLLSLEGALRPEGDIKKYKKCHFKCYCICQSTQEFMLKSPQLWALGCRTPVSSTFLTPKLALKVVSENANNF